MAVEGDSGFEPLFGSVALNVFAFPSLSVSGCLAEDRNTFPYWKMNPDKCKLVGLFGSLPGLPFILLVSFHAEYYSEGGAGRSAAAPEISPHADASTIQLSKAPLA